MPPYGERRTHHVHILEPTSDSWDRTLLFRNYLRDHADEAERYQQLKRELARRHREDREAYTRAKDSYVLRVIDMAR
jgi:GrpB-like predicted nucleotidyltransferase (UPF0157 family)